MRPTSDSGPSALRPTRKALPLTGGGPTEEVLKGLVKRGGRGRHRSIEARAAAGFDPRALGEAAALKRGALTRHGPGASTDRLKQTVGTESYAVLDEYLELGDPFDSRPSSGCG